MPPRLKMLLLWAYDCRLYSCSITSELTFLNYSSSSKVKVKVSHFCHCDHTAQHSTQCTQRNSTSAFNPSHMWAGGSHDNGARGAVSGDGTMLRVPQWHYWRLGIRTCDPCGHRSDALAARPPLPHILAFNCSNVVKVDMSSLNIFLFMCTKLFDISS